MHFISIQKYILCKERWRMKRKQAKIFLWCSLSNVSILCKKNCITNWFDIYQTWKWSNETSFHLICIVGNVDSIVDSIVFGVSLILRTRIKNISPFIFFLTSKSNFKFLDCTFKWKNVSVISFPIHLHFVLFRVHCLASPFYSPELLPQNKTAGTVDGGRSNAGHHRLAEIQIQILLILFSL